MKIPEYSGIINFENIFSPQSRQTVFFEYSFQFQIFEISTRNVGVLKKFQ